MFVGLFLFVFRLGCWMYDLLNIVVKTFYCYILVKQHTLVYNFQLYFSWLLKYFLSCILFFLIIF